MVIDNSAKKLELHLNGEPVRRVAFTGSLQSLDQDADANHVSGEYYIGSTKPDRGAGSFFARHFKGFIGEIRIYNRALSEREVHTVFSCVQAGKGLNVPE